MDLKRELRNKIKQTVMPAELRLKASEDVVGRLKVLLPYGTCVGGFMAKSDEPSLDLLFQDKSLDWVFPRIQGDELHYYRPQNKDAFELNEFQILEPKVSNSERVDLSQIQILLVPGMAFDRKGGRLGRGKGYYDRTLKNFSGLKVGVIMADRVMDRDLPLEEHDQKMDIVVTNQYILRRYDT